MGFIDNVIHLFAPIAANCRDFQNRWDTAMPLGREGISGCWDGEWISAASGHRGRLRCVVNPVAPTLWKMHFRGDYAKVFRACYSTDFTVVQEPGRWTFSGGSELGALAGGRYTYTGHATLDQLVCEYRSARDHGELRLARFVPGAHRSTT
ncbi:MAG: hypothetical protein H0W08_28020 [Acidobacteria bacterium]|nr:hypothetical protein [Acidobacteriota bacterium]